MNNRERTFVFADEQSAENLSTALIPMLGAHVTARVEGRRLILRGPDKQLDVVISVLISICENVGADLDEDDALEAEAPTIRNPWAKVVGEA